MSVKGSRRLRATLRGWKTRRILAHKKVDTKISLLRDAINECIRLREANCPGSTMHSIVYTAAIRARKDEVLKEYDRIWNNKNWIRYTRKDEELPFAKPEAPRLNAPKPRHTVFNNLQSHKRLLDIDTSGFDSESFAVDRSNRPATGRGDGEGGGGVILGGWGGISRPMMSSN